MIRLNEKLVILHEHLDAAGIHHAFGGAIAFGYCTDEPRATIDLDVNVFVPVSSVKEVIDALPEGVKVEDDSQAEALKRGQLRLWWDETAVDLFFSYHTFHDQAASRIRTVPFEDTEIPVLDCTDLVVLKAIFDRTKDWADIEAAADSNSIDAREAERWLSHLMGTESAQFRRLMAVLSGARGADALQPVLPDSDKPKREQG